MRQPCHDSGFTLVEVLATVALLGVMMGIAVAGYASYSGAHEQSGTARSLQSGLRQAQQRAVTEGRAVCVTFSPASYVLWRSACSTAAGGTRLGGAISTQSADVRLDTVTATEVTFTPRGTATWPGIVDEGSVPECGGVKSFRVRVDRSGSDKTYRLCVTALTGRVELHG